MLLRRRFHPQGLIAAGLFGMALYPIVARTGHPAVLSSDSVRGAWIGACIGLELVGVSLFLKLKVKPRA